MKDKKLLIFSAAIPAVFISLMAFREFLEYNFRGSAKYGDLYAYGSTIALVIQFFLVLISFLLTVYILLRRKHYSFKTNVLSLILGSSVFIYFAIMLLISIYGIAV